MILGLHTSADYDYLFLATEPEIISKNKAFKLILEHTDPKVPITIWTVKKEGERMIRRFYAGPGPASERTKELFALYSYIPLYSVTDSDEWRTVILDNISKMKIGSQFYYIN